MTRISKSQGIESAFNDVFPIPIPAARAPTSSDTKYPIGQVWIRTDTGVSYTLTKISSGAAAWSAGLPSAGGDLDITGNIKISGAAKQLQVEGGAVTDFIGQATLVSGTVTIANTNIAATDKVFVTREGVASSTALGVLDVSITATTSFTITALQQATPGSTQTGDLSIVNYFIVRQL